MLEDPLIAPVSPGAALERLSHVAGALSRIPQLEASLQAQEPLAAQLLPLRDALLEALSAGEAEPIRAAFAEAQSALRRTYEALCQPGTLPPDEAANIFRALRFPDPLQERVSTVDVSTVVVTFSKPERQVMTTIAFSDAPGAIGYRLREVRYLRGEELEDDTVSSYQPQFRRVRLPIGLHHFRIESRDLSVTALSELFSFEVPDL